jgi:hypothetical protein
LLSQLLNQNTAASPHLPLRADRCHILWFEDNADKAADFWSSPVILSSSGVRTACSIAPIVCMLLLALRTLRRGNSVFSTVDTFYFPLCGARAQLGPVPPHCWGF